MANKVGVILGAQWGDEGKGKIVDTIAADMDYVCRCQGGSNAGHTVVVNGVSYFFHLLPSGLVNPKCRAVIGNGVVIHIPTLFKELDQLKKSTLFEKLKFITPTIISMFSIDNIDITDRLYISDRAHIVFDFHQTVDGYIDAMRGNNSIGTTKKGIGPAYSSKMLRNGIRMCELMDLSSEEFEKLLESVVDYYKKTFPQLEVNIAEEMKKYQTFAQMLKPFVCDTIKLMHQIISEGKKVLVEGANGCLLDIDFGTYPYVTSSNTGVAGVLTGLGLTPQNIGHVNIVVKAYTTRVGDGPFPSEEFGEIGEQLRAQGQEFGTTTGRPRRCGWLDLVVVRSCVRLNGATSISLTKIDVLNNFDEIKIVTSYVDENGNKTDHYPANQYKLAKYRVVCEVFPGWKCDISKYTTFDQLPENCKRYIQFIESSVGIPVSFVGIGKGRKDIIRMD